MKASNIIDPIILGVLRGGHIKEHKKKHMFPWFHTKNAWEHSKKRHQDAVKEKKHEQEFNASTSSSTNAPLFLDPQKIGFHLKPPKAGKEKIRNNKQILACHVINPKITDMIREPNTLGSTGSTTPRATGQVPYLPHTNSRPDFSGSLTIGFPLSRPYEPTPYFWGVRMLGGERLTSNKHMYMNVTFIYIYT